MSREALQMDEVIYWGEVLGTLGVVLFTVPNTSYVYLGCKAGMSLPSTFKLLVRTPQFWMHVACIGGALILDLVRSPSPDVVDSLWFLFGLLFVMTLIVLATIWGIRLMENSDRPF